MRASVATTLVAAVMAAAPALADVERRWEETFDVKPGQTVRFELSVGEVRIEGGPGDKVRVEVSAECRWAVSRCETLLEELRLAARSSDRKLRIELKGDDGWGKGKLEIEALVVVPAGAPLEVDMGVGELDIRGVESDVEAELGVGEVRLSMDRSRVQSVAIDAGIGEAELRGAGERIEGRRSMLVGSEVFWDGGSGRARVELEVGVGEATVRLD